jgi:nitroreductase
MPDQTERGFFAVALAQRAHRELLPDPLPDETVERLLEAATHAPSAENRQPWLFVVVRDAAVKQQIGAIAGRVWRDFGRDYSRGRISDHLLGEVERWATGGLAAAPVIVVVCGDTSLSDGRSLAASVYPATQNLCLAAQALGLGSLFSTLPTATPELSALLGLPEHVQPMSVVPLGLPARALRPPKRVAVRDKTFRDRYGTPW